MKEKKENKINKTLMTLAAALLLTLILAINAQTVKASFVDNGSPVQTLYDCGSLTTTNAVYTVNQTISSSASCLNIAANNITIDCAGYTITYSQSSLGYGILSSNYNSTTIKNCSINDGGTIVSSHGIFLNRSSFGTISNNTIITSDTGDSGIYIYTSSNNSISNNNITTNGDYSGYGIGLYASSKNNSISNNNITTTGGHSNGGIEMNSNSDNNAVSNNTIRTIQSGDGIHIDSSTNNILTGNKAETNVSRCYNLEGILIPHYNNTIDSTNLAEGLPVNYTYNAENIAFENISSGQYGQFIVAWSRNITITNSNFSYDSLSIYATNMSTISNCIINTTIPSGFGSTGIYAYYSSNDSIINSKITTSGTYGFGIYLYSTSNFTISNNTIKTYGIAGDGIRTYSGSGSKINNNNITIDTPQQSMGIIFSSYSNSNISNNTINILGGYNGIQLNTNSNNNTLSYNKITSSSLSYGLLIDSSTNNTLTNNEVNTSTSISYMIDGASASHFNNTIDSTNLAEGMPVNFTCFQDNLAFDNKDFTNYGQVTFCWSKNITITNSNFSYDSLSLFATNSSTIANNRINTSTSYGIYLYPSSSNNNLSNNIITTSINNGYGIYLNDGSNNNIMNNNSITTLGSDANAIYIFSNSNNNSATNNFINTTLGAEGGIYIRQDQYCNANNNTIYTKGQNAFGIYLYLSGNCTANNNTITTLDNNAIGIFLASSSSNNMSNNTIKTSGNANAQGFRLDASTSNRINNNKINLSGSANGFYLRLNSNDNIISNNTIMTSIGNGMGIYLESSTNNNTFSGMNITTNGTTAYGIYLYGATNSFTMTDSKINASRSLIELYVNTTSNGGVWNFTNVSRANGNPINISWSTGANGTLNMHWYLDAGVSSGRNRLESANVTSYNNQANLAFSELTGSDGRINKKTLLEYSRVNGTSTTMYSPYNLSVSAAGYPSYSNSSINLSNNQLLDINLAQTVYSCDNLNIANAYYILDQTVQSLGTCFNILANNITLDCHGYSINYSTNSAGAGINTTNYDSITIKNCQINDRGYGNYAIYSKSNNGIIENNTISSNYGIYFFSSSSNNRINNNKIASSWRAIYLNSSSNSNNITNNTIFGSVSYGVYLDSSSNNNNINNNTITTSGSSSNGVYLDSSSNNNFTNNKVNTSNGISYVLYGTNASHYNNSIDSSNLAEGLPVNYTYNADNLAFNSFDFTPYGEVIFAYSRNITITNSNFTRDSLNLFYTNSSTISNNTMNSTAGGCGIYLFSRSNNNNINNNTITTSGNSFGGIYLYESSNNNNTNNNIKSTSFSGIYLVSSSNNTNINNTITSSNNGIYLLSNSNKNSINNNKITSDYFGIYLQSSNNTNIINNSINITVSQYGIMLNGWTYYTNINNNTITSSGGGISGSGSNSNITNNIITSSGYGIGVGQSNNVTNNLITTTGSSGYGINMDYASNNNIRNNTITTSGSSGYGIYTRAAFSNYFSAMNITTNGTNAYAIYADDYLVYFNFNDSTLNASKSGVQDFYINNLVDEGVWNFINVTRADGSPITVNWSQGGGGTLNMYWYLDVNVTNSTGALPNANVTSYNNQSAFAFSELTGSNGKITRKTLLQYARTNTTSGTNYTWSSPYNLSVAKTGYASYNNQNINLSNNIAMDINLMQILYAYSCGDLDVENGNYILANNVSSADTCFNILANNITLDCQGYNINYSTDGGDNEYGVNSSNHNFTTIKNCNITEGLTAGINDYPIYYYTSSNGTIFNNAITTTSNSSYGIYLYISSNSNNINNNNITITGNWSRGINIISGSNNNNINNNTITTTDYYSYGILLNSNSNNINNNNITTTDSNSYGIYLIGNSNSNISNNIITSSGYGITLSSSSNNNNTNNTINSSGRGIWLDSSSNNNNNINNTISTTGDGIYLGSSSNNNNNINNTITTIGNSGYGIHLYGSSNNNNTNNIVNATNAIYITTSSNNNNINNNTATTNTPNGYGLYLGTSSNNNNINNNTITTLADNAHGVFIESSTNNTFTNNKANTSMTNSYVLYGTSYSDYNNSIDASNLAEGLPVNYTYNADNLAFDNYDFTPYGQVIFGWSRNITITNSNFSRDSLNLFNTNTSIITNNSINTSTGYGIFFLLSIRNNLNNNNITTSSSYGNGIRLESSSNNNNINNIIATNSNYSHGIYLIGSQNSNITNSIINTTGSNSYGIYVYNSQNSNATNNTITTNGTTSNGIYLYLSPNSNNINNTITTNGTTSNGIYFDSSSNSNNINNTITTKGSGYGITLYSSSNNNNINNTITTKGSGISLTQISNSNVTNNIINTSGTSGYGIYLYSSSNNKINNGRITTSDGSSHGIFLNSVSDTTYSSNNNITNITITTLNTQSYGIAISQFSDNNILSQMRIYAKGASSYAIDADFSLDLDVSDSILNASNVEEFNIINNAYTNYGVWEFTNVTQADGTPITIKWQSGSDGTLRMKWYLDVTVRSPSGLLQGANVTARDDHGTLDFSELTSSNGKINRKTLTQYTRNGMGGGNYIGYNHNLTVTKTGYLPYTNPNIGLTNNLEMDINLSLTLYSCADLSIENGTYTLGSSVSSTDTCINILANNITLDCQGYKINYSTNGGDDEHGVNSNNYNFTTIKNCNITEDPAVGSYDYAIYYKTSNGTIYNNTITTSRNYSDAIYLDLNSRSNIIDNNMITTLENNARGIQLYNSAAYNNITNNIINTTGDSGHGIQFTMNSNNNIISNNTMTPKGLGIYFYSTASYNTLKDNTITTTGNNAMGILLRDRSNSNNVTNNTISTSTVYAFGIRIEDSTNNTLTYNQANTSMTNSYALTGSNSTHYNNTIDTTNLAEGMPVNYTYNASDLALDNIDFTPYGEVIFGWGRNITITNSNFSRDSLNLFGTNTTTIANNRINTSTGYGIWLLTNSNNSNISNNTITTSSVWCSGVFIQYSGKSSIDNNTITTSGEVGYGIFLASSDNINATNNIITPTGPTGRGILANTVSNCKISNNTINTSGSWGVGVYLASSTSNSITNNNITTNGIYLGHGIFLLANSNYNNVTENIINTLNTDGFGIDLESNSNNNNVNKNTITTRGGTSYGIQIRQGSNNNIITNNNVTTYGTMGYGISIYTNTNNNTFSQMNVRTNGTSAYALYLNEGSHNFTMTDSKLNASKAGVQELFIYNNVTGSEWNFTNVTDAAGNPITINWSTGANGTLNMHWYLDVYVRNSTNGLQNANVTSYDNKSALEFSENTSSLGTITKKTLLEYSIANKTTTTVYSPYNLTATKTGYYRYSNQSINMSNNIAMDIELSGLTLIAPENASNFNYTAISFNASAKVNFSYCGLSIDNAPNLTMTLNSSNTGSNYTQTGLGDGYHNFTITCNDTANIFLTTDLTRFLVDTINPSINVTSPISQGHYKSQTVLINVSSSEEGTGSIVNDIDKSLVLYMRMDDHSGTTVYDKSSYGNNGTTSGTYSTAGKYGGAYSVNNSNNNISVPYDESLEMPNNLITISAWVYMTDYENYPTVLDSAGGVPNNWPYVFEFNGNTGKITFWSSTDSCGASCWSVHADTAVPLNTWTHIAATYNGSTIQYYFNGNPDGTQINPLPINMSAAYNAPIQIGTRHDGFPFHGKIDEVILYNRILSADEIKSVYNATKEEFNATLSDESHTLTKYTQDIGGNLASSGLITFDTDITPPMVYFTGTTPINWANLTVNNAFTNVSSNDSGKEHSTFVDWNNSLVLWMRMDDRKNATYIYDNSTYGNNGTAYGNTSYTIAGKRGEAVQLDGNAGSYIATADIDVDYITIAAWVKAADSNTYGYIVNKNLDGVNSVPYSLNIGGNAAPFSIDGMAFYSSTSWKNSGITTDVRADKQWHFVAGTYNGTHLMYYVDGVLDRSSTEGSGALPKNNNLVDIGRYATDGQYFNGSIDDVMIFSRALNAREILALYNATSDQYYNNFTRLNDGNYTYTAYAQDMAGNVNTTETRNLNIYYACSCHTDSDWIVGEDCSLDSAICNMPDYKIICLDTGSIIMSNYTINAKRAITPINHGCIFLDNRSKLTIS